MEMVSIPQNMIAEKAYELFKSRGGKPGNDLDDWLSAEKELAGNAKQGSTVPFRAKKTLSSAQGSKYAS